MTNAKSFSDFNHTSLPDIDLITERTDELIKFLRNVARQRGQQADWDAAIAITTYEQARTWAMKSLG
jgi:hypothetical protein